MKKQNRQIYKGLKTLMSMENMDKRKRKEKICNIKVYQSTWKILMQIKLDKGFKSIDELLNHYYDIKNDIPLKKENAGSSAMGKP